MARSGRVPADTVCVTLFCVFRAPGPLAEGLATNRASFLGGSVCIGVLKIDKDFPLHPRRLLALLRLDGPSRLFSVPETFSASAWRPDCLSRANVLAGT